MRADLASQGIAACRAARSRASPKSAAGTLLSGDEPRPTCAHGISSARSGLVREMEREFKTAAALDAAFDYAGPERNLGLLYREAPGWPVSIGSKRKARELLEQAVKLAPGLSRKPSEPGRSLFEMGRPRPCENAIERARRHLADGATNFTGEPGNKAGMTGHQRRDAARKKAREVHSGDSRRPNSRHAGNLNLAKFSVAAMPAIDSIMSADNRSRRQLSASWPKNLLRH